jgi:predicted phage tail protein
MAKTGFRAGRNEQTTQENLELLTGQRGNGLDRAITLRDLASTSLVSVGKSASGIYTISTSKSGSSAVLVPITPTGFEVSGSFSSIILSWNIPKYTGHSHTEIWRGTMETFTDAAMIATTPASVFGDLVATGSSYYYWIRHVNTNDRAGAYNSTLGTLGKTSRDISNIIDDIASQMEQSYLVQNLLTKDETLSGSIAQLNQVFSSDSQVIAKTVSQLNASLKTINDTQTAIGNAKLTELREVVAEINDNGTVAYRAMWSMKASAGDITAGIGILAKSDGTSQVAVSASQFFIFDPNTDDSLIPLFAVSDGAVTIPKAFIEEATIQVLNAQTITADYVKAGISIDTPTLTSAVINGAEIHIGTGFNVTQDGYMTATSGKFAGRIEASDGFFNGNISSATMNGGSITGALITGAVIMGSQIYTGDELYLCFGDNVNTNQSYTFNSGIYVSAKKTIAITTQVNVQTNGQTPDNCLEFYAAGDKSMGFVSQERARYRTIPADVFDIRFDRSSLSGSGFMEFHLQMVGQSNNVIADVKITSPDSMPSIGTEFNVGGVVFYVYDNNLLSSSESFVGSPYHVKSFGIRNRRSYYGPGWTSSVGAVGRFRSKIYSTNDGGGTVTYKATINNSVDPR